MDVEGLAQWLSDYNAFRGGLLAGPFDTFEPAGPMKLENRLRQAAALLRSQAEEIERLTEQVRVLEELSRAMEQTYRNQLSTSKGLLEQRDFLARQLQEAVEARDRYREALWSANPSEAAAISALTERSKPLEASECRPS